MNRLVALFTTALITLSVASCQRKAVHKNLPDFVGKWHHEEINGESWYIDIGEKSWGTISIYDAEGNYTDKYHYGENPHIWRYNEKKQELTLRLIPDRFKVNQLPTVAETTIINGYDTIPAGRTYCILKDDYYIKY
jgi:hypothetical protein